MEVNLKKFVSAENLSVYVLKINEWCFLLYTRLWDCVRYCATLFR
jgi:hypothetical protein